MPPLSSRKVSDKELAEELGKFLIVILKVLGNGDERQGLHWLSSLERSEAE